MARHVVILAGGSGTRLWPRSREKSPKHLLTLHGAQSLLQSTHARVSRLTDNVYVVTEQSQLKSPRFQRYEPDAKKPSAVLRSGFSTKRTTRYTAGASSPANGGPTWM